MRNPDEWNRFQYQDKIVLINAELKRIAGEKFAGFIDYHSAMKDENGELHRDFAMPDGTHLTFEGYQQMAKVLAEAVSL